jgi:hypothetical protein
MEMTSGPSKKVRTLNTVWVGQQVSYEKLGELQLQFSSSGIPRYGKIISAFYFSQQDIFGLFRVLHKS